MGVKVTTKNSEKKMRMLQAARTVMAREGFANTTVSLVAEEAGVSRGLIHYHFASKEEMLASVLRQGMETACGGLNESMADCETVEQFASLLVSGYRELFVSDPAFFRLFMEGLVAAQNSSVVREEMLTQYEMFGQSMSVALLRFQEKGKTATAIAPRSLAKLITALMDGYGCLLGTNPDAADEREFWDSLEMGVLKLLQ